MMAQVGEAFELALAAHAGQTDKAGAPYIAHVVRVTAGVASDKARVVALLHDVVEDTEVTLQAVEARFGPDIAAAVDALTRREGEAPEAYYTRVRASPLAREVKLADIADNADPRRLALLPDTDRDRLTRKYAHARAQLME
jgi:(p)ppGpp synthase/HD superfamily hydrolase